MKKNYFLLLVAVISSAVLSVNVVAQEEDSSDLAQELTNPIADLMTIPIQVNVDRNIGLNDEGSKTTINIQPVVPFKVSEDWNLITRTIVPIIYQSELVEGTGSAFGLGDTTFTGFFSPSKAGDWTWGVGPIFLLPTATDDLLGSDKWGIGPSVIAVTMPGNWVIGGLMSNKLRLQVVWLFPM